MRRAAFVLALLALAGAGAWIALRTAAAEHERPAAPAPTVPGTPGARPGPELAAPASAPPSPGGAPPAERVALSGAAVAEAELRDARGEPMVAAAWVVFRGEEVLASGVTASDGVARYARGTGAAELAVRPSRHPLQRFPCDLARERQTITLDAGVAVAGFVAVDGFAPSPALGLTLDFRPPAQVALPAGVLAALGSASSPSQLATHTNPAGAFRFDGLPAGSPCSLSWGPDLFLVPDDLAPIELMGGSRLRLETPAENVRLVLRTGALLTGTVVDPATGAGVSAQVVATFLFAGNSFTRFGASDEHGRIAYSFPELPERVELRVSTAKGAGMRDIALDVPPDRRKYDLGSIALLAGRTVAFLARDAGGQPLEGAEASALPLPLPDVALAGGAMLHQAPARSDAEGRGSLTVPPDATGLRVVAAQYEPAEAPLPPGEEPAVFVLRPGTMLEVHLPAGVPRVVLALHGTEPPFLKQGEPSWSPEPAVLWTQVGGDGEASVTFSGHKDGVYVLTGVRPGLELALSALDTYGTTVAEVAVPPLAPGERRVIELAALSAPRTLSGRVVSASGEPVEGATVLVGAPGSSRRSGSDTDPSGRFSLTGICAPSVRVNVKAEGYAPLAIEDQPVTDAPLELVLDPGRDVRVTVVGPGGAPVPAASVRAKSGAGEGRLASQPEAGVFVLADAPSTACTLVVLAGGSEFEQPLLPGAAEARVELPAWSTCMVRVPGWPDRVRDGSYVALRSLDLDPPRRLNAQRAGPSADEARFDVVFPGRYEVYLSGPATAGGAEPCLSDVQVLEVTAAAPAQAALKLEAP